MKNSLGLMNKFHLFFILITSLPLTIQLAKEIQRNASEIALVFFPITAHPSVRRFFEETLQTPFLDKASFMARQPVPSTGPALTRVLGLI